jgi:hypothetical protein
MTTTQQTPSPVAAALEQYKFRTHYKAYVLDPVPEKRRRGLFTVVFVHSDDTMPMVSVHFVPAEDCERDEYAAAFLKSQPLLKGWLEAYDPKREFLIAAALTEFGATGSRVHEQVAQSARLTFEQLAKLDAASYELQQARASSGASRPSKKKKKQSRKSGATRMDEVACTDSTPSPLQSPPPTAQCAQDAALPSESPPAAT